MPFKPHPTDPTKVIYKTSEYWIPKPWQGLTDEDTANICMQSDLNNWRDEQVIDAVEAKLKEKNGV